MDLEDFQNEIGGITLYQVFAILASGWMALSAGFATQSAVFLSAFPDYRCAVPPIDDSSPQGLYPELNEYDIRNYTIPYDSSRKEYDSCRRYAYNLSACTGGDDFGCIASRFNPGIIPCDKGYYYDRTYYDETTVTQWNLVCDREYLNSIANTLFFFGFFIGSAFVGPLSDWFGRTLAMMVLCCGLVASSVGCSFTPTFELFVFVRVLTGAFSITSFITAYTYAIEISSTKWRTVTASYLLLTSAIAHCVYPGIAYALRDWHYIQLTIGLVPVPFIIMYFFIPESPRWLLRMGKIEKARKVIERYAKSKNKSLDMDTWNLIIKNEQDKIENADKQQSMKKFGVWDLFRRPLMRLMSINVMICWFTVSMVFYGLALNGGNLAGDPYVNNTLNGAVEIVAYFLSYLAAIVGRRPMASIGYTGAGVFCIGSMLFDIYSQGNAGLLTASTAMALIGKLCASLSFALIYAVTSEIFPTNVRTTALSMGSMAARVGAMISPFILQLQSTIPWLTQTVFGTLSIICGVLTLIYPETVTTEYMTSLDEAEDFYRNNTPFLKWFNKKKKRSSIQNQGETNHSFVDNDATSNITKL